MLLKYSAYLCLMETKFIEKAFNAMADKYRLAILLEVASKGNLPVSELQELTGLSQPCVSHHVKILAESGLVEALKEGRNVTLHISREKMQELSKFFEKLV